MPTSRPANPISARSGSLSSSSVEFGPHGALEAHGRGHIKDVDDDSDLDLLLHFVVQETGISCGDTLASLTGETFDGQGFEDSDSISTKGCK